MYEFFPSDKREILSFLFDNEKQIIEVVFRESSNIVLTSNPPQSAPDKVWKETYGLKDSKLVLLETKHGKHIPRTINHEQIVFE